MKCDHIGCQNEAKYFAGLKLRVHENHKPAKSSPMVFICEEHKEVKWEDLVNEEGWGKICNNFLARGLAVPLKKYSSIYIEELKTN